jgi:hypothetical protein
MLVSLCSAIAMNLSQMTESLKGYLATFKTAMEKQANAMANYDMDQVGNCTS